MVDVDTGAADVSPPATRLFERPGKVADSHRCPVPAAIDGRTGPLREISQRTNPAERVGQPRYLGILVEDQLLQPTTVVGIQETLRARRPIAEGAGPPE